MSERARGEDANAGRRDVLRDGVSTRMKENVMLVAATACGIGYDILK